MLLRGLLFAILARHFWLLRGMTIPPEALRNLGYNHTSSGAWLF
jgi:hypothetical protein